MVERRLGRGLDFFLSRAPTPPAGAEEVAHIEVTSLVPSPYQARQRFTEAELQELADSIQSSGLLQPILVRKTDDPNQFELIAGERRWRAAKMAGLERIPALIRELEDDRAAVFGLVENLQRADLDPIEKAQAFSQVQEMTQATQEEVARQVGLDRSTVANFQRLLDLPEEVQAHVSRGTLSMGHARALLGLGDPEEQKALAEEIIRKKLSVRQVEALIQELSVKKPKKGKPSKTKGKDRPPWLIEIEETLEEAYETPVSVRFGKKRATITIECRSRDEFERIYEQLKGG